MMEGHGCPVNLPQGACRPPEPHEGPGPPSGPEIYRLRRIKKYHGPHPAVDIEHLDISSGTITGLVGPNGSGKSSLLRLLAFVDRPSEGDIFFRGHKALPFDAAVRFQVSMLPQEPYLLKRSVFDNIAYGLGLRGMARPQLSETVAEALSLVGLTAQAFAGRSWYQLSGGEAQRVALAARMVLKPGVLILDEPTASVDAASAEQIKACALKACREQGTTLIVASHDREWIHDICDRIIPMAGGRIMADAAGAIFPGPWVPAPGGGWGKLMADGQWIRVPHPPSPTSVAAIPPQSVSLGPAPPPPSGTEHTLKGILTRLALTPDGSAIHIRLKIAEVNAAFPLASETARHLKLFPGQHLYLTYPVSAVVWY